MRTPRPARFCLQAPVIKIVRWVTMCKKMIEDYEKQMSGK